MYEHQSNYIYQTDLGSLFPATLLHYRISGNVDLHYKVFPPCLTIYDGMCFSCIQPASIERDSAARVQWKVGTKRETLALASVDICRVSAYYWSNEACVLNLWSYYQFAVPCNLIQLYIKHIQIPCSWRHRYYRNSLFVSICTLIHPSCHPALSTAPNDITKDVEGSGCDKISNTAPEITWRHW